ncbi:MAG: hypothetical protein R6U51_00725 [Anaerolineales bacterium]
MEAADETQDLRHSENSRKPSTSPRLPLPSPILSQSSTPAHVTITPEHDDSGAITMSPEQITAEVQRYKEMADITLETAGQKFTYRLGERLFIFLDDEDYPLEDLVCEPDWIMGYISNGSFRGPERYPIYYEATSPGVCTLHNGDFSVEIKVLEPTPNPETKDLIVSFEPNPAPPIQIEEGIWLWEFTYDVYNPNRFPVEIIAFGDLNQCYSYWEECSYSGEDFKRWFTDCGEGSKHIPAGEHACNREWGLRANYLPRDDFPGVYAIFFKDENDEIQMSMSEEITFLKP